MTANLILIVAGLLAVCGQPAAPVAWITAGALLTFVALRVATRAWCAKRRPVERRGVDDRAMITPRGTVRRGLFHRR